MATGPSPNYDTAEQKKVEPLLLQTDDQSSAGQRTPSLAIARFEQEPTPSDLRLEDVFAIRPVNPTRGPMPPVVMRHAMTLVGRKAGCKIRPQSKVVSGVHCAIIRTPRDLVLRDLSSNRSTTVNDWDMDECRLRPSDSIGVGKWRLVVERTATEHSENQVDEEKPVALELWSKGRLIFASTSDVIVVGRDSCCDLVLGDAQISRVHAIIYHTAHGWMVGDLLSSNGTILGAKVIGQESPIEDGDTIALGTTLITVRFKDVRCGDVLPTDTRAEHSHEVTAGKGEARNRIIESEKVRRQLEQRAAALQTKEDALQEREKRIREMEAQCAQREIEITQDISIIERDRESIRAEKAELDSEAQRVESLASLLKEQETLLLEEKSRIERASIELDERANAIEQAEVEVAESKSEALFVLSDAQKKQAVFDGKIEKLRSQMEKSKRALAIGEERNETLAKRIAEVDARETKLSTQEHRAEEFAHKLEVRGREILNNQQQLVQDQARVAELDRGLRKREKQLCKREVEVTSRELEHRKATDLISEVVAGLDHWQRGLRMRESASGHEEEARDSLEQLISRHKRSE